MQKNIICSSAATVLFLYPVHLYFQNFLKKKKRELERELGIDVLKVNRCLGFGIENKNNHCNHTEFSCNNLTCDIGKLCYVLNFVKRSKECVDVCIYYLTAKVFANVFIEAHRRGVRVRVIADDSNLEMTNSWISVFLREGPIEFLILIFSISRRRARAGQGQRIIMGPFKEFKIFLESQFFLLAVATKTNG
ncbi:uncharacterized protein isoform X3 [Rhodnius prolixus]|uniref:uncharacterized protein isoform X3 n=1 Tax=Rhodnius prolixus TaxID=13249 RepID=UPI003D18A6CF